MRKSVLQIRFTIPLYEKSLVEENNWSFAYENLDILFFQMALGKERVREGIGLIGFFSTKPKITII